MNAPQVTSLVGRHVGRYRVSRHIASGGMGAVYEVVQDVIGHRAAMKVLSSGLSQDPKHRKYVERFLDEARAVNLINHPGVLQIFDFGEMEDQTVYVLMEYIEGAPLSSYLSRFRQGAVKRMPIAQIMHIIRQVASVMAVAHDKGVLHRDIKPSNVMLVTDPNEPGASRVKVIDFGLARFLDTPERRTTAGITLGTAHYMSPEQCLGEEKFDGKVDVYALGAMLYELLSGDPPFAGEAGAVMRKHVNDAPRPLREVTAQVPEWILALTHRMLEKQPEARPSMAEVVAQIAERERKGELQLGERAYLPESVQASAGAGAPTVAAATVARPDRTQAVRASLRPPRPQWIAALLGGGILLGAVGGVLLSGRSPAAAPPTAAPGACAPPETETKEPTAGAAGRSGGAAAEPEAADEAAARDGDRAKEPDAASSAAAERKSAKGRADKGSKKSR